ncbi:MAG: hypothetical protein JXR96_26235 [Deltaproteobacteria bacterium]|nr:hypothetical protein [Deltaproteobacteria bacterium]
MAYPLSIQNERELPDGYDACVFVWDIDKTYLATRFSSMRGLSRIPFEFAIDKRAIPGMPEILRGLRRGPGPRFACAPLYFVSASPPQLRSVVQRKMQLDGVEWDGIIFKDWLGTLMQLRPGRLRDQIGFKLAALLTGRLQRAQPSECLFGDDVESDAEAFWLYARILDGELGAGELEQRLISASVPADDRQAIQDLISRLPAKRGSVEQIYVHLERNSPPEAFARFGERVCPVKGACQLGLALFQAGHLDAQAVRDACQTVAASRRYRFGDVDALAEDALARGLIEPGRLAGLEIS